MCYTSIDSGEKKLENIIKQGFDKTGEECYWNVSGDNVSAISLIKFDEVTLLEINNVKFKVRKKPC